MSETWYEILGVESTATESEIKGAWRSLVTVLGPTDHRFASINEAASVLLDPDKRAAYDAGLEPVAQPTEVAAPAEEPVADEVAEGAVADEPADDAEGDLGGAPIAEAAPAAPMKTQRATLVERLASPWITIPAAALAVVLLATTAVLYLIHDDGPKVAERTVTINLTDANLKPIKQQVSSMESTDITAAVQAAIAAAPKALSYDYRHLAKDRADALAVMTPDYAASNFTPYFDGMVTPNAPKLKQLVVCGPILDAGVVRTAPNLVEVLLLLDRFASNKSAAGVSQDFAVLTMKQSNGVWLISNFATAPIAK